MNPMVRRMIMIRVSGLLIEDMRTAVCIRFCVAAKEGGTGGEAGAGEGAGRDGREEGRGKGEVEGREQAREGEEEEKEQGERSVLPEGTKRQRVSRRQDASGIERGGKRRRRERAGMGEMRKNEMQKMTKRKRK